MVALQPRVQPRLSRPSWWAIGIPLLVQVGIVVAIPAQKAYTLATGTTVFLQTVPVDPYDLLRGRYVTLDYQLARWETLEALPGWSPQLLDRPTVFITLKPGATPEAAWIPVAIAAEYPAVVEPGQQVIRGRWQGSRLDLGLGEYFIPEAIGDDLEADLRQHPELARAEVKVDAQGRSALVRVWVADRSY
ncbi:MAG: GDYXXLXY domain-containing protein [Thermostichales cyanobacterium BF4_bins_65]